MPIVAVSSAVALILLALANSAAARGRQGLPAAVFWLELVVIIVPAAIRLLSSQANRTERLGLVVVLVLGLYLVKVLYEPTAFALHDELGQWRTTDDILTTGNLFGFNPIVRAYPYFPGLNAATAAVAEIGHVSIFVAGTVVVGVARLVGGVSLFLLLERIVGSDRLAALGLLVYLGNPNYLYFDAQYAYESLALPLAFAALFVVALNKMDHTFGRWSSPILATLILFAVIVTHHLTSYWVVAVLVGWATLARLRRRWPTLSRSSADVFALAIPATLGFVAVLAWELLVARGATGPELEPVAHGVRSLAGIVTGSGSAGKALFKSSTGQGGDPPLAQLLGFTSVVLALIILPLGWWRLVKDAHRRNAGAIILALSAILLPLTLALRFTQAGTETSSRASEFLYVGLAVLAPAATGFVPAARALIGRAVTRMRFGERAVRSRYVMAFAGSLYAVILFIGGFIVGWAPFARQPGPYLAAAGARSIEPIGVQAALWARSNLPAGAFVATDATNGLLMGSYGRLSPQTGSIDGLAVPSLFYSNLVGPVERRIIEGDKISYIVVDRRLSQFPPMSKGYFAGAMPSGVDPAALLAPSALSKFDRVATFSRIYDSGGIVIYGTGRS